MIYGKIENSFNIPCPTSSDLCIGYIIEELQATLTKIAMLESTLNVLKPFKLHLRLDRNQNFKQLTIIAPYIKEARVLVNRLLELSNDLRNKNLGGDNWETKFLWQHT